MPNLLAQRIESKMVAAGKRGKPLSYRVAAAEIGVSHTALFRLARLGKPVGTDILYKVAAWLGLTLDEVYGLLREERKTA